MRPQEVRSERYHRRCIGAEYTVEGPAPGEILEEARQREQNRVSAGISQGHESQAETGLRSEVRR